MLRMTLVAVAAVLLTPALAHGATLHGTVTAKQTNRHVLVVAMPGGHVVSARVSRRQLEGTRVGTRLGLVGKRLADGTLLVTRLRRFGAAHQARLSVVVLKARAGRLLVAGGGSTFSIHLTHAMRLPAGKDVEAAVTFSPQGPVATEVHETGDAGVIDFSGVVTAIDTTTLTVSSDGVATVIRLPAGTTLPASVQVGSEVELVAANSGSSLTLITIKLDGERHGDDGGTDVGDQGAVKAEGFVTALGPASITVQPGDNASPVTFAVPDGFTLPSALVVGSVVEARGEMVNDVLTLTRIELQNEDGDQEIEAEGTVTALDAGSITIQAGGSDDGGGGNGGTFTFAIPDGFVLPDQLALGTSVKARGELVDGVLTLTRIELEDGD
jgi:hypothetical protein